MLRSLRSETNKVESGDARSSQVVAERHGAGVVTRDGAQVRRVLRHDGQQLLAHLAALAGDEAAAADVVVEDNPHLPARQLRTGPGKK